jgi:hypothetical protein
VVPIPFRGVCLRDNKEDNEKRRKQDEKRLEIQCMILFKSIVFVFIQTKECFEKGNINL